MWIVHVRPDGQLPRSYRKAGKGRAAMLPELDALAHGFPFDLQLRQLKKILNPAVAADKLAPWLPVGQSAKLDPRPRVVRYKPLRRCVIEYRARSENGKRRTLYGKCQRTADEIASRRVYDALADSDSPATAELSVAQPCGSVSDWHMLVWHRSPGESLSRLLVGPDAERVAAKAGRALAAFHRIDVHLDGEHGPQHELDTLSTWVRLAGAAFPSAASVLRPAQEALVEAASRESVGSFRPAHRDFHDGQLLVHRDRVVLLDLDTASNAEPELDAANFLAHLRHLGHHLPGLATARLAAAFLDAYTARRCRLHPERLRWYEASASLRLASVHAFRPSWSPACSALAKEALGLVDALLGKKRVIPC